MARERFFSGSIFIERNKVQASYREIAIELQVSRRTAISRIKKDVANGYIMKQRTGYSCKKYKTLLDGKNIYRLTEKGKAVLGKNFLEKNDISKQNFKELVKTWFTCAEKKRKNIFQKILKVCPMWWKKDIRLLKKTLCLLRAKISKGYKVRSILRWVSSALKQQGAGYRRRNAILLSSCVSSLQESNSCAHAIDSSFFYSPYIAEGVGNLAVLAKEGLDVSVTSMIVLLRKGFDHLAMAAKVLLRIKKKRVQNPNAFLNYLVSLEDPFDALKRKEIPQEKLVEWTKEKLASIKERCLFLHSDHLKPKLSDPGKIYVYFGICKQKSLESFLRIFFYERSSLYANWQEVFLRVGERGFQDKVVELLCIQKGTNSLAKVAI